MTSPIHTTPSPRECAEYILTKCPRLSLAQVNAILFNASMDSMFDRGILLFAEQFFATRRGPEVKSVSLDWLRRWRVSHKRRARRLPALRRRVRLWCIQENDRTRSAVRLTYLNAPGGWGTNDDGAIRQGVHDYYMDRLLGKGKPWRW